jgi:hypothetical protein
MMELVKINRDDNDRKYYDTEMGREGLRVPIGADGIPAETQKLDDGLLHPFASSIRRLCSLSLNIV